jgi:hypothetical protein
MQAEKRSLIFPQKIKFWQLASFLRREDGGLGTMPNKIDYLGTLEAAIIINHKCKPAHKETVFVSEKTRKSETMWEGDVEIFHLIGHDEAKICYAWQYTDEKRRIKIFAVLENQFIDSARKAVQAALFMGAQPPVNKTMIELQILKKQLEECHSILRRIGGKVDVSIEAGSEISGKVQPAPPRQWRMN